MAFMIKGIDLQGILFLMLLTVTSQATNLDCYGKAFHCVNSTHFMICVDLGRGTSTTIDDVVIPCPSPTVCSRINRFECEFPLPIPSSTVPTTEFATTVASDSEVTTFAPLPSISIPFEEYFNTVSTTSLSQTEPQTSPADSLLAVKPITEGLDTSISLTTENVITEISISSDVNATRPTIIDGSLSTTVKLDTSTLLTTENVIIEKSISSGAITTIPTKIDGSLSTTVKLDTSTLLPTENVITKKSVVNGVNTTTQIVIDDSISTTVKLDAFNLLKTDNVITEKSILSDVNATIQSVTDGSLNTTVKVDTLNLLTTENVIKEKSILSDLNATVQSVTDGSLSTTVKVDTVNLLTTENFTTETYILSDVNATAQTVAGGSLSTTVKLDTSSILTTEKSILSDANATLQTVTEDDLSTILKLSDNNASNVESNDSLILNVNYLNNNTQTKETEFFVLNTEYAYLNNSTSSDFTTTRNEQKKITENILTKDFGPTSDNTTETVIINVSTEVPINVPSTQIEYSSAGTEQAVTPASTLDIAVLLDTRITLELTKDVQQIKESHTVKDIAKNKPGNLNVVLVGEISLNSSLIDTTSHVPEKTTNTEQIVTKTIQKDSVNATITDHFLTLPKITIPLNSTDENKGNTTQSSRDAINHVADDFSNVSVAQEATIGVTAIDQQETYVTESFIFNINHSDPGNDTSLMSTLSETTRNIMPVLTKDNIEATKATFLNTEASVNTKSPNITNSVNEQTVTNEQVSNFNISLVVPNGVSTAENPHVLDIINTSKSVNGIIDIGPTGFFGTNKSRNTMINTVVTIDEFNTIPSDLTQTVTDGSSTSTSHVIDRTHIDSLPYLNEYTDKAISTDQYYKVTESETEITTLSPSIVMVDQNKNVTSEIMNTLQQTSSISMNTPTSSFSTNMAITEAAYVSSDLNYVERASSNDETTIKSTTDQTEKPVLFTQSTDSIKIPIKNIDEFAVNSDARHAFSDMPKSTHSALESITPSIIETFTMGNIFESTSTTNQNNGYLSTSNDALVNMPSTTLTLNQTHMNETLLDQNIKTGNIVIDSTVHLDKSSKPFSMTKNLLENIKNSVKSNLSNLSNPPKNGHELILPTENTKRDSVQSSAITTDIPAMENSSNSILKEEAIRNYRLTTDTTTTNVSENLTWSSFNVSSIIQNTVTFDTQRDTNTSLTRQADDEEVISAFTTEIPMIMNTDSYQNSTIKDSANVATDIYVHDNNSIHLTNPLENITLNSPTWVASNQKHIAFINQTDLHQTVVANAISNDIISTSADSLTLNKNIKINATNSKTDSSDTSTVETKLNGQINYILTTSNLNEEDKQPLMDYSRTPITILRPGLVKSTTTPMQTSTLPISDNINAQKSNGLLTQIGKNVGDIAAVTSTPVNYIIVDAKYTATNKSLSVALPETVNSNSTVIKPTKSIPTSKTVPIEFDNSFKQRSTAVSGVSTVDPINGADLSQSESTASSITNEQVSQVSSSHLAESVTSVTYTTLDINRQVPSRTAENRDQIPNIEPTIGPVKRGLDNSQVFKDASTIQITVSSGVQNTKNTKDNDHFSSLITLPDFDVTTERITTSDVLVHSDIESEKTHSGIISFITPSPKRTKEPSKKAKPETKKFEAEEKPEHPINVELTSLQDKGFFASPTDIPVDISNREELLIKNEGSNFKTTNRTETEQRFGVKNNPTENIPNGINTTASGYKKETPTHELIENSIPPTNDSHTSNNKSQDQNMSIPQAHNKTVISNVQSSTSRYMPQTKSTAAADTQTTRFPALKSTNQKTELNNFSCKQKKRGRYADELDCRKFYICPGNKSSHIIEGTCPVNTVFSEINKQCTKNLSHCIRNNQFRCVTEGRFNDFLNDNIYYICVQNNLSHFIRFKLQCQNGYLLNRTSVRCVLNNESTSMSESKSASEQSSSAIKQDITEKPENKFNCKKEGLFPDPSNCEKYFECTKVGSSYRQKKKKCDSDENFHKDKKKCVDADSYEC